VPGVCDCGLLSSSHGVVCAEGVAEKPRKNRELLRSGFRAEKKTKTLKILGQGRFHSQMPILVLEQQDTPHTAFTDCVLGCSFFGLRDDLSLYYLSSCLDPPSNVSELTRSLTLPRSQTALHLRDVWLLLSYSSYRHGHHFEHSDHHCR
jgi:hypothetical protein